MRRRTRAPRPIQTAQLAVLSKWGCEAKADFCADRGKCRCKTVPNLDLKPLARNLLNHAAASIHWIAASIMSGDMIRPGWHASVTELVSDYFYRSSQMSHCIRKSLVSDRLNVIWRKPTRWPPVDDKPTRFAYHRRPRWGIAHATGDDQRQWQLIKRKWIGADWIASRLAIARALLTSFSPWFWAARRLQPAGLCKTVCRLRSASVWLFAMALEDRALLWKRFHWNNAPSRMWIRRLRAKRERATLHLNGGARPTCPISSEMAGSTRQCCSGVKNLSWWRKSLCMIEWSVLSGWKAQMMLYSPERSWELRLLMIFQAYCLCSLVGTNLIHSSSDEMPCSSPLRSRNSRIACTSEGGKYHLRWS